MVDATLKEGTSHIYKRRTLYFDEDSWQILLVDQYDNRDQLWRVSEGFVINYYDVPMLWTTLEVHTDLQAGRYLAIGLDNEYADVPLRHQAHAGGLHSGGTAPRGGSLTAAVLGRPGSRPARFALRALALLTGFALAPVLPALGAPQDDAAETSLIKPLASQSLLLDAAEAGGLMVAVGERGHVLLSLDEGQTWRQVTAPTRSTLNAVFLHDDKLGWAVGHDAVILRTRDGGESWERLYWAPDLEQPLFDVWFKDADNGFAIGAYGLFLETADGGDSWEQRVLVEEEDEDLEADPYAFTSAADLHLNHISKAASGKLYIAAEAGGAFRSDDDGATWEALAPPYEGSFFSCLPLAGDSVLLFGLRGHLFRSDDAGESWRTLETGTVALLTDGAQLPGGPVILTGLAGTLLISRDNGESFSLAQQADRQGLATALPTSDGGLVLVGEFGVSRLPASALAP